MVEINQNQLYQQLLSMQKPQPTVAPTSGPPLVQAKKHNLVIEIM